MQLVAPASKDGCHYTSDCRIRTRERATLGTSDIVNTPSRLIFAQVDCHGSLERLAKSS